MKDIVSKVQFLMVDFKIKQVCKRLGLLINGFKDKGVEGKMLLIQVQLESRGKLKYIMRIYLR